MEEFKHSGIKGMRWGVRRYQNKDGSLTPAGKKRYADNVDEPKESGVTRTYSRDIYRHGKKIHSKGDPADVSGIGVRTHLTFAGKRVVDKCKKKITKETAAKAAVKGAEVAGKLMVANAADDIFYGGAGKRILKETVKQTGRAAVTAYVMANGGYDIRWYDK